MQAISSDTQFEMNVFVPNVEIDGILDYTSKSKEVLKF